MSPMLLFLVNWGISPTIIRIQTLDPVIDKSSKLAGPFHYSTIMKWDIGKVSANVLQFIAIGLNFIYTN